MKDKRKAFLLFLFIMFHHAEFQVNVLEGDDDKICSCVSVIYVSFYIQKNKSVRYQVYIYVKYLYLNFLCDLLKMLCLIIIFVFQQ